MHYLFNQAHSLDSAGIIYTFLRQHVNLKCYLESAHQYNYQTNTNPLQTFKNFPTFDITDPL